MSVRAPVRLPGYVSNSPVPSPSYIRELASRHGVAGVAVISLITLEHARPGLRLPRPPSPFRSSARPGAPPAEIWMDVHTGGQSRGARGGLCASAELGHSVRDQTARAAPTPHGLDGRALQGWNGRA